MKKMLVIMNPYAGMKQANRYLAGILDLFCASGYDVNIAMTQSAGDGTRLAAERASENDIVVAIGGDGTFNEVVSGVMESGHSVPIGYIPAGTTNDFASSVGLSKTVLGAAESVVSGVKKHYDVGSFNGRHFSYVASFGAFTSTSYEVPQDLKNAIGGAAYILSGIKDVMNIKPLHLKVKTGDTELEGDYIFGAVCNSTSMGGIINLKTDDVDMNDGLFEVMLIRSPQNIIDLNSIIFALTTQSYNECDQISFFSSGKIEIEAPSTMPWTLDGEYQEGEEHIIIENIYNAIELMVPEKKEEPEQENAGGYDFASGPLLP
ncbi:MAG: diacylglycerol kinase family lipid kinase [Eubacterium sp.]|nr:diacylglycerol kinase family lipid kinase [Eubacterium sp.]